MSATTGSAGRQTERVTRDPGVPQHLVAWPAGVPHSGGVPEGRDSVRVLDDAIAAPFSLARVIDDVRRDHPEAVVAAVYPSPHADGRTEDWIELSRIAAGGDEGDARRVFTGDTTPTSLRALRTWVGAHAPTTARSLDDLILATSELATNVERHARGWVTVDLVDVGGRVLVAVTDPAVDRFPQPRAVESDQISGRGLMVVAAVSSAWGVVARPGSKTVWAVLPNQ